MSEQDKQSWIIARAQWLRAHTTLTRSWSDAFTLAARQYRMLYGG
jgi:hypothetical protein